jgi:hypothetical protein
MAIVRADTPQALVEGVVHEIPVQTHRHTRGHQVHLDVTAHRDPSVTLAYDAEVSTDGGLTWTYGGGFTVDGGAPLIDKHGNPVRYAVTTFGHEPHPQQAPCPQRLVRGTLRVIAKPDASEALSARAPAVVHTRVHVVGTAAAHIDKSLIPSD